MQQVERIGVSLDKKLLSAFDELIAKKGYQSRSEAIRDLVREKLSAKRLDNPKVGAYGVVYLVYNHHQAKLMEKLTDLQHSNLLHVVCSVHIHLDEHDCMEVIVLKGQAGSIKKTADRILSQKGVKLGEVNLVAAEGK